MRNLPKVPQLLSGGQTLLWVHGCDHHPQTRHHQGPRPWRWFCTWYSTSPQEGTVWRGFSIYSSPGAGVTKDRKLRGDGLKTIEFHFLQFKDQTSKIKVTAGSCSLWGSRKESVPWRYPSSWWLLAMPGVPRSIEWPFPSVLVFTWHSVLDTSPQVRPTSIRHDLVLRMLGPSFQIKSPVDTNLGGRVQLSSYYV